jgi:hypothetical protein
MLPIHNIDSWHTGFAFRLGPLPVWEKATKHADLEVLVVGAAFVVGLVVFDDDDIDYNDDDDDDYIDYNDNDDDNSDNNDYILNELCNVM